MWGTDTKGSILKPTELSDRSKLDVPERAPLDFDVSQVVCGVSETAIIDTNGQCWVFGENKQGHLGVGHSNPVAEPTRVPLDNVTQVALGTNTGAFVDSEGDLFTCGFGGSTLSGIGALGQGEGESCDTPVRVDSLVEDGCYVKQVDVGESHLVVLTTEGDVLTAGSGSYGRLGNFETTDQIYLEPCEVLTQGVTDIACGKSFTLALTTEGVVYGWGRNHKGQLGTGFGMAVDMYAMQSVPEPIEADELMGRRVTRIAAGNSHAACITESGEMFYWGMSAHLEPVRVDALMHTKVVDMACGEDYTLAVGEDGHLYSFGVGSKGTLGLGSISRANQATQVEALAGKQITHISAGWKHAASLVVDA